MGTWILLLPTSSCSVVEVEVPACSLTVTNSDDSRNNGTYLCRAYAGYVQEAGKEFGFVEILTEGEVILIDACFPERPAVSRRTSYQPSGSAAHCISYVAEYNSGISTAPHAYTLNLTEVEPDEPASGQERFIIHGTYQAMIPSFGSYGRSISVRAEF